MRTFLILSMALTCVIYSNANGRGQIPTLPSYNCTQWEKWLNKTWREISLPHAYDCTRFYECDDIKIIEKTCADRYRTRYDPFTKRCEWNYKTKCMTFYDYSKCFEAIEGKKEWMV
ncbi:unnamed protein product [Chironomus riparius]|uniref:Chitin-binding type-2 domain-containing protein n=1 Tax=Chironomus riparius TaxID=315576 RepID=A0A9N9RT53_9DIPT|nr:unnamed protein product [Chironomus riparius]